MHLPNLSVKRKLKKRDLVRKIWTDFLFIYLFIYLFIIIFCSLFYVM